MKKIRKAVIPAAGYGTRFLPATKSIPKEMLPIIDKPTIQFIVEEAIEAGIEEILIITNSQKVSIANHFDRNWELEYFLVRNGSEEKLHEVREISEIANIFTVRQKEQKGLGDAILCARSFIGDEPFAVLLGDNIMDVGKKSIAMKELVSKYEKCQGTIIGVQEIPISDVEKYGIVSPVRKIDNETYEIDNIVEKPNAKDAPSKFAALGRYILTPKIFELLEKQEPGVNGEIQLTDSIKELINYEKIYSYNLSGKLYDTGSKLGYLDAVVDYALSREDLRDKFLEILSSKK